jgi:uncharacterized protein involved in tolerance to divalent cations
LSEKQYLRERRHPPIRAANQRSRSCSYDTPVIVVLPLQSVEKSYLGWLLAETDPAAK